ncbi:unnamed protein product [Menidia menidia]|uniref:(Atlantic silverside) hypothetical protein n=1 Tax=Menidia menidia TaxID=238744 RepID=A0A8S4AQ17_9TELE|nr:unnamed protein product [Menidia menidia]
MMEDLAMMAGLQALLLQTCSLLIFFIAAEQVYVVVFVVSVLNLGWSRMDGSRLHIQKTVQTNKIDVEFQGSLVRVVSLSGQTCWASPGLTFAHGTAAGVGDFSSTATLDSSLSSAALISATTDTKTELLHSDSAAWFWAAQPSIITAQDTVEPPQWKEGPEEPRQLPNHLTLLTAQATSKSSGLTGVQTAAPGSRVL